MNELFAIKNNGFVRICLVKKGYRIKLIFIPWICVFVSLNGNTLTNFFKCI